MSYGRRQADRRGAYDDVSRDVSWDIHTQRMKGDLPVFPIFIYTNRVSIVVT